MENITLLIIGYTLKRRKTSRQKFVLCRNYYFLGWLVLEKTIIYKKTKNTFSVLNSNNNKISLFAFKLVYVDGVFNIIYVPQGRKNWRNVIK